MLVPEPGEDAEGRGRRRRRLWSMEDKRRIVAETFEPGASVSMVARRHDLNANMLFTWRREAAALVSPLKAVSFVPATLTPDPVPPASQESSGRMEIALAGGARVIVGADVDAAALARVMKVLSRR